MINVNNLSKYYGKKCALDDISFSVDKGEVVGFLGANGAGKTTTMNIICGYLSSGGGTVTVDGFDVLEQPDEVKRRIGYLPEHPPLYLDMTVYEYLDFVYDLKKIEMDKEKHIEQILKTVYIEDVQRRLIKNLSKGYRQRVGLAQAMLGDPPVLIFDEPTVGLDPKQIIEIRNLICELGKNHTVILSSHILTEISAICSRVIILSNGSIAAEDTPERLSKTLAGNQYLLRIAGERDIIEQALSNMDFVEKAEFAEDAEGEGFDFKISFADRPDARELLFYALAERRLPILILKEIEMSLEEIFLKFS